MNTAGWIGAFAALAIGLAAPAARAQDGPVAIGTLPQGSLGFAIASGVAQVAGDTAGLNVRAVGQGGSSVFIPALNRGEIAFSTSNAFEAVFAVKGTGNFDGQPNPNIRLAALLQPFEVGIMVPKDSDIGSVADLAGRSVAAGYVRQRLVQVIQDVVLDAAGVDASAIRPVPVPNFAEGANLLAQGSLEAVLLAPGSGIVQRTHAQRPVRFLTVGDKDRVEPAIKAALPGAYIAEVQPIDRLPEIAEPVNLVGYQYALLTHADADPELVHAMVKALHGNKQRLIESHGSFRRFDPAAVAAAPDGVAFHPGAERFYRDIGILAD